MRRDPARASAPRRARPDNREPDLDRLWAPWRASYIEKAAAKPGVGPGGGARKAAPATRARREREPAGEQPCLFCAVQARRSDREDLVLARRAHALLMLNRYPYNPGHVMVAAGAHVAEFGGLAGSGRDDLLDLIALAERTLAAVYRPHGMNYGANVGRVAGAGFPGHLHVHLVPRWNGDTNFMPVVGKTKVLPESLASTWTRMRRAIRDLERTEARGARQG